MSKLTKSQQERLWFLRRFAATPGWSINTRAGKKWDAHLASLVKQRLLERDDGMYRITEAGRQALSTEGEG